jgi:hypothetical protein
MCRGKAAWEDSMAYGDGGIFNPPPEIESVTRCLPPRIMGAPAGIWCSVGTIVAYSNFKPSAFFVGQKRTTVAPTRTMFSVGGAREKGDI